MKDFKPVFLNLEIGLEVHYVVWEKKFKLIKVTFAILRIIDKVIVQTMTFVFVYLIYCMFLTE